jgi:hypothetical protein
MALDPSIPLQTTGSGQPFAAMSSLVGLKNQQQQVQAGQMANQQSAIDLQERQGVQGVLSNIKKYQDTQGNVDFNKLVPDIMSVAPTTGSQVLARVAQAQTAATDAHAQVNSLDAASRKTVGDALYSLKGQTPDVVQKTLQGLKTSYPSLSGAVDYLGNYVLAPHSANPEQLDAALDTAGKFVQAAPTQQSMNTPDGVTVNDGASTKVVSTKPGTAVAPGQVVPGTAATLRPGPGTATVGPDGTQGIVGAPQADFSGLQGPGRSAALADIAARAPGSDNAREAVNALSGRPQGFVPSSLPAGQAQNIANNVDEMNRHFGGLQDQAAGAQLVSGLTGNIKALAGKAITGTGSDKLAYANGLIATFLPGEHKVDDLKTATDLLDKNVAQLALGTPGGSTDAARALIGAARPNSHMTPEAIGDAADQVASQVKANMAMRNALQGYKMMGDVQGYANARQKLEQIADPRVFQFESADAAGRTKMLANLTADDKAQLRQKIQAAEEMGLVK